MDFPNEDDSEKKINQFEMDIKNEKQINEKILDLYKNEYEEAFQDILTLTEQEFFDGIDNSIRLILEDMYTESCFSNRKLKQIMNNCLKEIKDQYSINYEPVKTKWDLFNKPNKSYNSGRNRNSEQFLENFRKHCIDTEDYAYHNCTGKDNKFLIVTDNESGKVSTVICKNCQKVYFANMILCHCNSCNVDYYSNVLDSKEDKNLLPATWKKYHCPQIINEKMRCIKCGECFYLNLRTGLLNCLNPKCKFVSKPTRILWTCTTCKSDFKNGAIVYNPLEMKILKKIIRQTLLLKHKAHPDRVPCCDVNVYFTEFKHKRICDGTLYSGELNNEIIIVCDKCNAVNFHDKFIWTCPRCKTRFRDKKCNEERDTNCEKEKAEESNKDSSKYNNKYNSNKKYKNMDNDKDNINNDNNDKTNNDKTDNIESNVDKNNNYACRSFYRKYYKGGLGNNEEEDNNNKSYNIKGGKISDDNLIKSRQMRKMNNEKEENNNSGLSKISNFFQRTKKDDTTNDKDNNKPYNKYSEKLNEDKDKDKDNKDKDKDNKDTNKEENVLPRRNRYLNFRRSQENIDSKAIKLLYKNNDDNKNVKDKAEKEDIKNNSTAASKEEEKEEENKEENKDKYGGGYYGNRHRYNSSLYSPTKKRGSTSPKTEENSNISNNKEEDKIKKKKYILGKPPGGDKNEEDDDSNNNDINSKKKDNKDNNNEEKEENNNNNQKNLDENKYSSPRRRCYGSFLVKRENKNNNLGSNKDANVRDNNKYNNKDKNNNNNKNDNKSNKSKESEEEEDSDIKPNSSNMKFSQKTHGAEITQEEDVKKEELENSTDKTGINNLKGISDSLITHLKKKLGKILERCKIPIFNIEDFTLIEQLGEGSYGKIYCCCPTKDKKKRYALKKIMAKSLVEIDKFTKEFELVHMCDHPNIMKIYGLCIRILDSTTYALYVWMEKAISDWDKEIKKKLSGTKKYYTEQEIINILRPLSDALIYLQNTLKISHRDIKPQNILYFEGGIYKLGDFGEAKEAKMSNAKNTLRGTELYMSPLLYSGLHNNEDNVDHNPFKSDVFSMGFCVIYAATLNFKLLYELRSIKNMDLMKNVLEKNLKKYSKKFITLLVGMLEIVENGRMDFNEVKNYIDKNY